jgi:hypothetical protein
VDGLDGPSSDGFVAQQEDIRPRGTGGDGQLFRLFHERLLSIVGKSWPRLYLQHDGLTVGGTT